MSKKIDFLFRTQCSPVFAAAAAGAAVCLSSSTADATSGNIAASNLGQTYFIANMNIKVFGALASFNLQNVFGSGKFIAAGGGLQVAKQGISVYHAGPGVQIAALTNWVANVYMKPSPQVNNYIPMRFGAGPTKFGWVHCKTLFATGTQLRIDTWSYNASGGNIKTLDESITPKKLALSDGRVKLNWSNANEAGVARYEVQAKGANGAWAAVDSSTPGEGSYATTVSAGVAYRLVVESSDGSSRTVVF